MADFVERLLVKMEDGAEWEVTVDQRDASKWECSALYGEGRTLTMVRHLAWTASVRQGKTDLKWGSFDAALINAGDAVDDPQEAPPAVDPTRTDQLDGS